MWPPAHSAPNRLPSCRTTMSPLPAQFRKTDHPASAGGIEVGHVQGQGIELPVAEDPMIHVGRSVFRDLRSGRSRRRGDSRRRGVRDGTRAVGSGRFVPWPAMADVWEPGAAPTLRPAGTPSFLPAAEPLPLPGMSCSPRHQECLLPPLSPRASRQKCHGDFRLASPPGQQLRDECRAR